MANPLREVSIRDQHYEGKVGAVYCSCLAYMLNSSVVLALESVVANNLSQDKGLVWYPGYYSLPSPGVSRYPFINQPEKKD